MSRSRFYSPSSALLSLLLSIRAFDAGRGFARRVVRYILVALLVGSAGLSNLSMAKPTIEERGDRLEIRWKGDLVAEVRGKRHLLFRASGFNDHWIGTPAVPMDLGWDYRGVKDYEPTKQKAVVTDDGFTVSLEGRKPSIDGTVRTSVEARLLSPRDGFVYRIRSELTGSQVKWRNVSSRARGKSESTALEIEALDFHLNRISQSDLYDWRNAQGDLPLYEGFIVAHKDRPWRFIPALHTPFPIRKGDYPTIFWTHDGLAEEGYRIGFLDRKEGGWIQEFEQLSAPIRLEMCWLAADVHLIMPGGVPPVSDATDTFTSSYAFKFTHVSRDAAVEVLDQADAIEWQGLPEYQLPVFSRYNTFEERLSKHRQYVWCASSYECSIDDGVGFDDLHSIRISHTSPTQKSAWYAFTWGPHFDTPTLLKGRFRFSAMVKMKGASGPFRIAVAKFGDADLFLRRNGEWTSTGRNKEVTWFRSGQSLAGTSDWTPMHVDVDIDLFHEEPFTRHGIVLEYEGSGTIWFDNVRIQQLE